MWIEKMEDPGEGDVRDANCGEDLRKEEEFNQHFQMPQKTNSN